ncbi:deoxyribodipyrimidine photo-lyase [Labilibacter sediminis]|nr:deoxyribodipyrimidine photo-lyase [Labilibacter sediminis]
MGRVSIFWFRRDLRLKDNTALNQALSSEKNILPIFIFDEQIIGELPKDDARITFIYDNLLKIHQKLQSINSSLLCLKGNPFEVWKELLQTYAVKSVFVNKDYEPYAISRDAKIENLLAEKGIEFLSFKDQVILEENEVLKKDGKPYTVFTPYKRRWLELFNPKKPVDTLKEQNFHQKKIPFPDLQALGFKKSNIQVRAYNLSHIANYAETRDFPNLDTTSYLGPLLRFGTVSIRYVISMLKHVDHVFLSELIWREFFMQILYHFPQVVTRNFKPRYNGIRWINNKDDFKRWCEGHTGYPMVDAGMRQLNETGYMHNRIRMITAGFLCKHLLIDWRWGEAYFAKKLLDYELSSNNGNWQWAAGTGCDAAPYFRVFNPMDQLKKYDRNKTYVIKWIPELGTDAYPAPMIEHKYARQRALETYKRGIVK